MSKFMKLGALPAAVAILQKHHTKLAGAGTGLNVKYGPGSGNDRPILEVAGTMTCSGHLSREECGFFLESSYQHVIKIASRTRSQDQKTAEEIRASVKVSEPIAANGRKLMDAVKKWAYGETAQQAEISKLVSLTRRKAPAGADRGRDQAHKCALAANELRVAALKGKGTKVWKTYNEAWISVDAACDLADLQIKSLKEEATNKEKFAAAASSSCSANPHYLDIQVEEPKATNTNTKTISKTVKDQTLKFTFNLEGVWSCTTKSNVEILKDPKWANLVKSTVSGAMHPTTGDKKSRRGSDSSKTATSKSSESKTSKSSDSEESSESKDDSDTEE